MLFRSESPTGFDTSRTETPGAAEAPREIVRSAAAAAAKIAYRIMKNLRSEDP